MSDTPVGTDQEFHAAVARMGNNPIALSDRDLLIIKSTHPAWAAEGEQARAVAREAEERARLEAMAEANSARKAAAAAPAGVRYARRMPEFRDGESIEQFVARAGTAATPLVLHFDHTKAIAALQRRVAELEARGAPDTASLEQRLAAVEARPTLSYTGVWDASRAYSPGQFCTFGGSLWHANTPSVGMRPGSTPGPWTLAAKKGSDASGATR